MGVAVARGVQKSLPQRVGFAMMQEFLIELTEGVMQIYAVRIYTVVIRSLTIVIAVSGIFLGSATAQQPVAPSGLAQQPVVVQPSAPAAGSVIVSRPYDGLTAGAEAYLNAEAGRRQKISVGSWVMSNN